MNKFNPESAVVKKTIQDLNSWKTYFFFFFYLPTAWFWGLKIVSVSHKHCEVKLPYGWFSKNPFRSLYFAAQAGAAELSTGILARIAIEGRGNISMLVSEVHCEFVKKATKTSYFTCEEGEKIIEAVDKAIETGEGQTVTIKSIGKMADGQVVSITTLTWSFKSKT